MQRTGYLVLALVLVLPLAGAIQFNSSHAMKYYGDGSQLDFRVNQTGHITAAGDLNMTGNRIHRFFAQGTGSATDLCGSGEAVQYVEPDGSYSCVDIDAVSTDTDQQNLSEVLVHGNVANTSIDMDSNNIRNVNALSVAQALSDGNISNGISVTDAAGGSVDKGTLQDTGTLGFDWQDGEVADSITVGSNGRVDGAFVTVGDPLATGNISNNAITNAKLSSTAVSGSSGTGSNVIEGDSIDSGEIAQNAIGGSELANTGSFTMNDLTVTGSGVSATFQNDVQVQGDLDVWGNMTNTDVQNLNVNGSLMPPAKYDGMFDVGNGSQRWNEGYFAGNINLNGSINMDAGQTVDGVDINNPSTGIEVNGQQLRISTGAAGSGLTGGGSQALAVQDADGTLSVDGSGVYVPNSGIGNIQIQNGAVNGTQIQQMTASDGQVLTWDGTSNEWVPASDAQIADDQNLSEVLAHGNVANTSIAMSNSDINSVREMVFNARSGFEITGSGENDLNLRSDASVGIDLDENGDSTELFTIRDGTDSHLLDVREGGAVDVPQGDLAVRRSDSVPVRMEINNTAGSGDADAMLDTESSAAGENGIRFHHDGTRHWALLGGDAWGDGGSNLVFYDYGADVEALRLKDGTQNVEIPNGDLNMSTNSVLWENLDIMGGGTTTQIDIREGGNDIEFRDTADADIMRLKEASNNVEIPNGNMSVSGNITVDGAGGLVATGGDINTRQATSEVAMVEAKNTLGSGDGDALVVAESSSTGENGLHLAHDGATYWTVASGDGHNNQLTFRDVSNSINVMRVYRGGGVGILNGNLDMNANQIRNVAGLNVTNTTSGTQIADFQETGVTLHQPLSVESSGAMSVANGIDLTDTTSNTIESYGAFYLRTSSGGSPKDIALDPSGIVGVQSNLSMGNNHITNLADPDSPQEAATKRYVDNNAGTDNQDLSETLVHGNVANRSINMGGSNNVTNTMKVSMGNGMKMVKRGNNVIISD